MARIDVVGLFAALYERPRYLEIGVQRGHTFSSVNAEHKVAVDPEFLFDVEAFKAQPEHANAVLHEIRSDVYFGEVHSPGEKFDLIFIDGLHTFDQTLRDLLNAMECLAPGGAIIIDDVMPSSYAASLSGDRYAAFRGARGMPGDDWMGDVYRLVYFLRDYLRGFSYATVQETHAMTVVWREPRPAEPQPLDVALIAQLDFADAVLTPQAYNLLPVDEIIARVRQHVANTR